jgi:UTP:GlnB (protein PII) uridylyltransferase
MLTGVPPAPMPSSLADRFRVSMPASYRRAHGPSAVREHAQIVERRGDAPVHVEVWRVRKGTVVAIVSDDRPGGLSMMSAAIAASGFDILVAEAYSRAREGAPTEAVAFFELRRPRDEERSIGPEDVDPIARSLESLLDGSHPAVDGMLRRNARTVPPGPQASPEVTFADEADVAILLVEARDRPGLLAAITNTLAELSAKIIDCQIATVGGRVRDRFQLTELDGRALTEERRALVAQSVLASLEQMVGRG